MVILNIIYIFFDCITGTGLLFLKSECPVFPSPSEPLHCEKSLFVLASRKKIPALRTEIPAVDTRTICHYPCQKSYGRKIPARNNRYGRKFPAFWCQKR
jgi:hypothetical protein